MYHESLSTLTLPKYYTIVTVANISNVMFAILSDESSLTLHPHNHAQKQVECLDIRAYYFNSITRVCYQKKLLARHSNYLSRNVSLFEMGPYPKNTQPNSFFKIKVKQ